MIELEVVGTTVQLEVSGERQLSFDQGEYIPIVTSEYPDYDGSYVADALFSRQVFPTKRRAMRDDFTVNAINYTEAPNDSGITVTIGG